MAERYLRGAIHKEKDGDPRERDFHKDTVRFLQRGCGIDFEPPIGRQRLSTIETLKLKFGTEKNGELMGGLVIRKYDFAIGGKDMVRNLPDDQINDVVEVVDLGYQFCLYRLGVSEAVPERFLAIEGKDRVETLEDLKPGTRIATKHFNLLGRIIRERGLSLNAVYDPTPETAPELRGIYVMADLYQTGSTWVEHLPYKISPREVFLESQAVLAKARKLSWGTSPIFYKELLTRVYLALEHPERWLNPDTWGDSKNNENQKKRGT